MSASSVTTGRVKSTLPKPLAGQERPDNGEVSVSAPGGIGHLAQTFQLPGTATVADAIDLALADIRELENRSRNAETELGADGPMEPAARSEAHGGHQADRRVDIAPAGPGLRRLRRTLLRTTR